MAIEELLGVVPPPVRPVEKGRPTEWAKIQQALGTALPGDYRDFGIRYGTGYFEYRGLAVLNPFSIAFLGEINNHCRELREARGLMTRRSVPYGVFPDRPGWLPCAYDADGNRLCWLTEGEPDNWPLILIGRGWVNFQQVEMRLTSLLTGLLSGRLVTIFGTPFEEEKADLPGQFVPEEPRSRFGRVRGIRTVPKGVLPHLEGIQADELGRPCVARTFLGPRGLSAPFEGFTVYPPWWTELPRPREQWVRHHLLSWRLGGPGKTALHNMIPLTRSADSRICPLEYGIALGKNVRLGGGFRISRCERESRNQ